MWRLTHDQKYRDWGWDAVQALEKYCRTPTGYCGLKNVYLEEPQKDDVQQSFFLAETLKVEIFLFELMKLTNWNWINYPPHPFHTDTHSTCIYCFLTTHCCRWMNGFSIPKPIRFPYTVRIHCIAWLPLQLAYNECKKTFSSFQTTTTTKDLKSKMCSSRGGGW